MAFDGVFAFQGKNHITASQLGRLVQGTAGDGRYVLPTQDRLQATMQTANKVVIGAGDLVMDGRYVTNEGGVELTVESGTSGYNRNDIVALRYSKDGSTGVESFEPEVIKGAPVTGTAADPAVDAGAISDGSSEALMPLWRIPIRGLAPGTPERIATVGKTLSEIGDSVSQMPPWVKHKQFSGRTSASGNFTFDGLIYGKAVILFAYCPHDYVVSPYYQLPSRSTLGAHIIRDANTYIAVANTELTIDVWYCEIPSA